MFRFRHKTLIFISGMIWLTVGAFLLPLGLHFIVDSAQKSLILHQNSLPLLNFFAGWTGGFEQAAMFVVALALMIGFFKGRYVISKSVNRLVNRIRSFPEPTPLSRIYSPPYYILLSSMILIGVGIKYLGVPYDIRGMVDVAIGAALINGAMLYFRLGMSYGKELSVKGK